MIGRWPFSQAVGVAKVSDKKVQQLGLPPSTAAAAARRRHGLLGGHGRRAGPPPPPLARRRARPGAEPQPEVARRLRRDGRRRPHVRPRRRPPLRRGERRAPHGPPRRRRQSKRVVAAPVELGQRPDGAAPKHRLHRRLAQLPAARAEQPHGAAHRVDRPPGRLVHQRLEHRCITRASEHISHQSGTTRACVREVAHWIVRITAPRAEVTSEHLRRWVEVCTWALRLGDGGEEGHEAGAAEELGDEDGGVALRLGAVDPLQARPQHARVAAPLAKHAAPVAAHPRHHPRSTGRLTSHTTPSTGARPMATRSGGLLYKAQRSRAGNQGLGGLG
jgi:hypothetical protein